MRSPKQQKKPHHTAFREIHSKYDYLVEVEKKMSTVAQLQDKSHTHMRDNCLSQPLKCFQKPARRGEIKRHSTHHQAVSNSHSCGLQLSNLFEQRWEMNHYTVSDDTLGLRVENSRGHKMQRILLASAVIDCMASIGSTL